MFYNCGAAISNGINILNSKILTVLLSILSVWVLFSVFSVEIEKDKVKKEERNVEAKIENVKQGNDLLEKYIKGFENPSFLEKEARLRLNYKKQGEEVVFVYRDLGSGTTSASKEFSLKSLSNYKKWWWYHLWGY